MCISEDVGTGRVRRKAVACMHAALFLYISPRRARLVIFILVFISCTIKFSTMLAGGQGGASVMVELQSEAEEYNQNSVLQKEVGNKLLETLCLKQGDIVLDLGCGTGYLASVASQKVGPTGKIVAVDPDLERILIAQEKYHHLKNTSISEGSSVTGILVLKNLVPDGNFR